MEEGDGFTAHLYAECVARNTGARYAPLMTWGATELIMVCPSFWTLPAGLTRASCPAVVDNAAAPNDEALLRSMYGTVVNMLTHVYLPETLDYGNSVVEEVSNVQDAIELSATRSLRNANNYALYAACKWLLSFPGILGHVAYSVSDSGFNSNSSRMFELAGRVSV